MFCLGGSKLRRDCDVGVQHDSWGVRREKRLACQNWSQRDQWWGFWCLIEGQTRNRVILDWCKGGGGVIPHLQCSAVRHQPISSQLRGRGRGQRLTTAKESSRSDTATENKWEREAVVVRASGLVPNSSSASLLVHRPLFCVTFDFSSGDVLPLCSSFFLFLISLCFLFLCGWSERLFFPNTYTLLCPPPLHHIPWASVHLAGKSSRSVSVRADVITTDSLRFASRHFQVFMFLQRSLSSDNSSW